MAGYKLHDLIPIRKTEDSVVFDVNQQPNLLFIPSFHAQPHKNGIPSLSKAASHNQLNGYNRPFTNSITTLWVGGGEGSPFRVI